jgi:hypothetical protein
MSTPSTHLIRYGLVLLSVAAAVGCDGEGVTDSEGTGPSYSLTLTRSTFSGAQGTWTLLTTLRIARTAGFTGNVALSVENLPTGVDAYFYPAIPPSPAQYPYSARDVSSELRLFVRGEAPTGAFTNLLLRGVASGLPDRTAPLTLTITEAPFVLTLSSPTLSVMRGSATPTTTVNVVRNSFTGPVSLSAIGTDLDEYEHFTLPPGVTAAFAPNPTTGASSELTLTVDAAAVPGVYDVQIHGEATSGYFRGPTLRLTITQAPSP